ARGPASDPQAAAVRPDAPPEYDVLVAQQLGSEGDPEQALEAWRRAVAKDPGSAYLQRRLALALAQQGLLDEALEHAQLAVTQDPRDEPGGLSLAQLPRGRRGPAEAQALLVGADGEPIGPDAADLLWPILLEAGRAEEALGVARWLAVHEPEELRGRIA